MVGVCLSTTLTRTPTEKLYEHPTLTWQISSECSSKNSPHRLSATHFFSRKGAT